MVTHTTIERGREDVMLLFDVGQGEFGQGEETFGTESAIAAAVSSSGNQAHSTGEVG
ncbi:MAG: hypothetical protein IPL78_30395 [Chloroflexi bacterium]|nr:hypothetical protein [Chloroflexota bacterium]